MPPSAIACIIGKSKPVTRGCSSMRRTSPSGPCSSQRWSASSPPILGGTCPASSPGFFGVVFLLGLGQAMSIAAQSALVSEHCREEIRVYGHDAVYGVYRLLERLGNALGPLLASQLHAA